MWTHTIGYRSLVPSYDPSSAWFLNPGTRSYLPITKVADCGLEPISSTPGPKHV